MRNAEALPKLLFSKKFGGLFRICASETFSWPNTLLALTNRTRENDTLSHWHAEVMGQVRLARHNNRLLENNQLTFLPIDNFSYV